MPHPTPDGELFCAHLWRRTGRPVWLVMDLPGAVRLREIDDLDDDPTLGRGSVVIAGTDIACRPLGSGGLLVGGGAFWALLDPARPTVDGTDDDQDRLTIETAMRGAARRFVGCARWWRRLDASLRQACRADVSGWVPDLGPLFDHLDSVPLPPETTTSAPASGPAAVDPRFCPPDPEGIYGWMCDTTGLGSVFGDNFLPRPEQAEMAREIAAAFERQTPLMVEAGTGVGKTLAYLVPLIASVVGSGRRAVVSTHTRALQSQIMSLDLPRLQPLLGDRQFRLLMGRRNYLCLRQERHFLQHQATDLVDGLRIAALRLWLAVTNEGLREELDGNLLLADQTTELFEAADLCLPGLCWEGDRCHVQRARRRAREADILIVNHALLLHDLRAGRTLLGDYDVLVVDEAHRLPAVTLDIHAVVCGLRRLAELDDVLGVVAGGALPPRCVLASQRLEARGPASGRAATACEDLGRAIARVEASFRRWWHDLGGQLAAQSPGERIETGRQRIRDKDVFFAPLRPAIAALLEDAAAANAAQAELAAAIAGLDALEPALEDDLSQVAQAGQLIRQLEQDVAFLTGSADEGWVTWIEPARARSGGRPGAAALGATLLEAGQVLRDAWEETGLRPVMTSATLAVGEDFTHTLDEVGLSRRRPATSTVICPSPFDYHEQCRVLVPGHFTDPSAPGFDAAVGALVASLARAVPRKMMVLFTSYRAIRVAQEALAAAGFTDTANGHGPVVLAQAPGTPAASLLDQFRRHPRAVLLGTATFWEGVDFPGEALEILVVAKLPFLVPNDPWVEARCDRLKAAGENPFTSFMVRDAVLRLRQGFGRLIRRMDDRGVVLILDNRLHTKNYGSTFLGALPTIPVSYGDESDLLERIDHFFGQGRAGHGHD